MIDRLLEFLALMQRHWGAAQAALEGAGLTVALILLAAILAAMGGMVSARMRLYGAIVGGMIINIAVKAMGGGFSAALAAMMLVTAIAFALGCTPLVLKLMRLRRPQS